MRNLSQHFFFDYYKNCNPLISYFSWKKVNIIVKYLKATLDIKVAKILDVGCGIAIILQKLGPEANHYGIDISRLLLKLARINAPWAHFKRANVKKIPFEDNFFDFVICNDILEHCFYPDKALAEIHRVAKPSPNRVILSIPNEFNSRIGRLIALRLPVKWPFHIHTLPPAFIKNHFHRKPIAKISVPIKYLPWSLTLEMIFIF
ncbi:MAG: class I SAM-dependent methyltransferase [Promethearchaeota archaeon]